MEREKVKMDRMDVSLVLVSRLFAIASGFGIGVATSALLNPNIFSPDNVFRIQGLLPLSLLGSAVGAKFTGVVEKILKKEEKL